MKNKTIYLKVVLLTIITLLIASTSSLAATVSKVTGLTVEIKNEQVCLEWNKVSNASGYEVYIDVPGRGYVYVGDVTKNKVNVIGFSEGKEYSAKIRAFEKENGKKVYGSYSSEVDFKFGNSKADKELGKVKNLKATVNDTKVRLTWSEVSNAYGYEVYVNIPNRGYTYIGTVTKNSVTVVGFCAGESYKVKVRAVDNAKNYGEYSSEVLFKTEGNIKIEEETVKLSKVTGLTGKVTGSKVKLTWNKVNDADGYEISMKIPGYGTSIMTTTATSKTIGGLTNTTSSYDTKVRAYKVVNGEKIYGEYSNTIKVYAEKDKEEIKLSKVTGLEEKVTNSSVKLTWNKVSNADGYEIAIKVPGKSTYSTTKTTGTTRTISGLTDEGTYKIKVRAYKKVNGEYIYGSYSSIISVKIEKEVEVSKVTGLKGTVTGSKVKLTWNKVSGADGYEIDMTIPGYGNTIMTTTDTTRTVSGLTETEYSYDTKVRAYKIVNGKKVYGAYSKTLEVYIEKEEIKEEAVKLGKVTGLKSNVIGTTVKLNWSKVSNADGYEIYIKIPGYGSETFTTTGTNKTIAGLTEDDTYEMKVRSYKVVNGKKVYGSYSNTLKINPEI